VISAAWRELTRAVARLSARNATDDASFAVALQESRLARGLRLLFVTVELAWAGSSSCSLYGRAYRALPPAGAEKVRFWAALVATAAAVHLIALVPTPRANGPFQWALPLVVLLVCGGAWALAPSIADARRSG
jgi:hypothetical protein